MTLVVAEKIMEQNGTFERVVFCSDSKISFGDVSVYYGAKLFSVPLEIVCYDLINKTSRAHNQHIGVAISGGVFSAYTIKDAIGDMFKRVQYYQAIVNLDFERLMDLVLEKYQAISNHTLENLSKEYLSQLIIGGFCYHQQKIRVFHFYPKIVDKEENEEEIKKEIQFYKKEILLDKKKFFMGNNPAKKYAESYIKTQKKEGYFALEDVINNSIDKTVGGEIQYGDFVIGDKGVYDFRLAGVSKKSSNQYIFRGLLTSKGDPSINPNGLFIPFSYVDK